MPLAVAPCQVHEIPETSALDCFVRERYVRHGSRAARGQLTKSVLDELRAEPEHFQKGAHLLKLVERALAGDGGLFPFSDRKSTRLNSSHRCISYAVFCLKKKTKTHKN